MAASDVWLFRPAITYRVRPGSDQGTFVPLDEPLAPNAPNGALLDYYLKQKPSGPIQLEIFDSEGKLVRRFASDDELPHTDPRELRYPPVWVREPQPLSAEAGMHRFVWDLRYPQRKGVRSLSGEPMGVLAPPGNYMVRLTANGKSSSQPLTVKIDPRVKTPQDALVRQFELASRIAAALGDVSAASHDARELRKQIDARKKEAGGNVELQQALDDLASTIEIPPALDTDDYFELFGLALPAKEREPLPRISNALTGLLAIVESADVAPPEDAITASGKWEAVAAQALERWSKVQKEDLPRVNALLEKAKLKPLAVSETPKKP